jgi:hypothetical protein
VKLSVRPSILLNNKECSPQGANEGVNFTPRGQISPQRAKLGARGEVNNGPLVTLSAKHLFGALFVGERDPLEEELESLAALHGAVVEVEDADLPQRRVRHEAGGVLQEEELAEALPGLGSMLRFLNWQKFGIFTATKIWLFYCYKNLSFLMLFYGKKYYNIYYKKSAIYFSKSGPNRQKNLIVILNRFLLNRYWAQVNLSQQHFDKYGFSVYISKYLL